MLRWRSAPLDRKMFLSPTFSRVVESEILCKIVFPSPPFGLKGLVLFMNIFSFILPNFKIKVNFQLGQPVSTQIVKVISTSEPETVTVHRTPMRLSGTFPEDLNNSTVSSSKLTNFSFLSISRYAQNRWSTTTGEVSLKTN